MLRIIQTNSTINYLIIFFLLLGFWTFKFIYMPENLTPIITVQPPFTDFFEFLFKFKYLFTILSFILYYGFAFYLIQTNIQKMIVETAYQMPGIFLVIFSGIIINAQQISIDVISVCFVNFSLFTIFKTYKKDKISKYLFDAGCLFAIALIFSFQYLFFFIFIIIALALIRNINFKEILALFIGVLTPLIIFYTILYITYDDFILQVNEYFTKLSIILQNNNKFNETDLYIYLPIIVISFTTALYSLNIKPKTIFSTKIQYILIILILFSIAFFLIPTTNKESIIMIYIPLSLLLSEIFIENNNKFKQILFYIILAFVILIQINSIILLYSLKSAELF